MGSTVDYAVEAMKPLSKPTRVTRFRSCYCFYDGEMEIFGESDLVWRSIASRGGDDCGSGKGVVGVIAR